MSLPRCTCGTAPRISSPIARVTSSGERTLGSARSRRTAPTTPAPKLVRHATTTRSGAVTCLTSFGAGVVGAEAGQARHDDEERRRVGGRAGRLHRALENAHDQ